CITSGMAFLDIEAVVIDGSFAPALRQRLIEHTTVALSGYSWEGLWQPALHTGSIGTDARALGGALLPLHANFAPDRELFLKVMA
ncbi:MAG: ROK family transcriptional regulator, partial [Rhodoferax sp.]